MSIASGEVTAHMVEGDEDLAQRRAILTTGTAMHARTSTLRDAKSVRRDLCHLRYVDDTPGNRCGAARPRVLGRQTNSRVAKYSRRYLQLVLRVQWQESARDGSATIGPLRRASSGLFDVSGIASVSQMSNRQRDPGDWVCPACSNLNWAKRVECNQCGIKKPEAVSQ